MSRRVGKIKVAAIALTLTTTFAATYQASAQFSSPIINDPTNGAQLIESVRESITKIATEVQKIDHLRKMVQNLIHLKMPSISNGFGDVNSALGQFRSQAGDLGKYPTDFVQQITNSDMIKMDEESSKAVREFAEKVKDAVKKIEEDRDAVTDRVQEVISASNRAEGEKSGQQAHNHLLSVMAIEQSKLSALRSLRSRLDEEVSARNQSREALINKYNEQANESLKALSGD